MAVHPGGSSLNISAGVREFARSAPGEVAVKDGDRTLSYRALDDRSNRLAQYLLSRGLVPGDPVALLMGNRLEYPEVAAGLAKAGLPLVPLNPRLAAPEIAYILEHSEARAVILDEALAGVAATAVADVKGPVLVVGGTSIGTEYETSLATADPADPFVTVSENTPFSIAYTSGTTGQAKGVLISHRSRVLTVYMSALDWGLGLGRRSIAVAPMYHGAGFAFGYAPVFTGGTVSMLRSWDPERLLDMVQRDRAQSVFLVPAHAQMLRNLGEATIARYDLSSLDTLFFNAAALPAPLKAWVLDTFPRCGVHELYGSTEAGVVTNLRPADARRKNGSVGHAWFMTELKVLDIDGSPTPQGQPGELFSRSPYLMNGYLRDDEATAACTTTDGFLSSGDIVVLDEEGYVTVVDRKKDMIISGGVNVYPRDVEEAVLRHPGVRECAVVGGAHELWGEQVVAYLVLAPDTHLVKDELETYLRPLLAGFKIPKQVHVVESLPRNAAGKVLKRDLRATGG